MTNNLVSLSVVTATYNAVSHLPNLIKSLQDQSDRDFEWVVMDGGSKDGTLELLQSVNDIRIVFKSQKDFGIYDALNRAIEASSGSYYLVVGADDLLSKDAILQFKKAIEMTAADIITAKVAVDSKIVRRKHYNWIWFHGMAAIISSHAVGSIFKKSLHKKIGFYSNKYPLTADRLFVKKAYLNGFSIHESDFIAGEYSLEGESGTHVLAVISEHLRIQIETGESKIIQIFIFIIRLFKNYSNL